MEKICSITLSFNRVPLKPYEWKDTVNISGLLVKRVTHKCVIDILMNDCIIESNERIMLLSDGNSSIAIRLDKDGNVTARSFLDYIDDLKVNEIAKHLKCTNIKYKKEKGKIIYPDELRSDALMRKYILESLKNCKNDNLLKYLYFKLFNEIDDYSKEKLLKSIDSDNLEKNVLLYNLLLST